MKKLFLIIIWLISSFNFLTYAEDDLGALLDLLNGAGDDEGVSTPDGSVSISKDGAQAGNVKIDNTTNSASTDGVYVDPNTSKVDDLVVNQGEGVNANYEGFNTNSNNLATNDTNHYAADELDNVVYNPFGYVKGDYVYVYYTPGKGIKNVKIFYSYDGVNFIPLITLSTTKKYYYFPVDFNKKEVFVKILPIDDNGNYGVMKEGVNEIPYIKIPLIGKKISDKKVGHAKTGPELGILFIFALMIYAIYRYRFNK